MLIWLNIKSPIFDGGISMDTVYKIDISKSFNTWGLNLFKTCMITGALKASFLFDWVIWLKELFYNTHKILLSDVLINMSFVLWDKKHLYVLEIKNEKIISEKLRVWHSQKRSLLLTREKINNLKDNMSMIYYLSLTDNNYSDLVLQCMNNIVVLDKDDSPRYISELFKKGATVFVNRLMEGSHHLTRLDFLKDIEEWCFNQWQLIFSTNDILLMDSFNRDQIRLVEKNRYWEVSMYSLAEFKWLRKDAVLSRQYIKGRFWAIPIHTDIEDVFTEF